MNLLTRAGLLPSSRLVYPTSPFSEGQLQQIVWSDVFDEAIVIATRAEAMAVPVINKARNLLCASIGRLPLSAWGADGELPPPDQPTWTYASDGMVSAYQRMVWTMDDLLFFGHSLWWRFNGVNGNINRVERIPMGTWEVTAEGAILVNKEPVSATDVIYFPGHTEGLLDVAQSTIKGARDLEKALARRAATPLPVMEIHHSDADTPTNKKEARELVAAYNAARRDPEGATVFTPAHIELKPWGDKADSGAMVEARNAIRLDVANFTNIPAALLDGSVAVASLTYVTTEGKKSEFLEFSLAPWIETIQSRLSMDDIVPRGQRVRFIQLELLTPEQLQVGSAETRD